MKILFINTPRIDGLSDVVYNGLLRLGHKVNEYPYKPFYHCIKKDGKIYSPEINGEKLVLEDSEGTIVLSNNMNSSREFITISDEKYKFNSFPDPDDYDLVIVGFIDEFTYEAIKKINSHRHTPLYFLDGGDHPLILRFINDVNVYFKREMFTGSAFTLSKYKALGNLGLEYFMKLNKKASISLLESFLNTFFTPST